MTDLTVSLLVEYRRLYVACLNEEEHSEAADRALEELERFEARYGFSEEDR